MKLLIIGGTQFLGRHTARAALDRGHEVTLFNRGRTDPEAFPDAEKIVGDRDEDLAKLAGRDFDAVIDTCGFKPSTVTKSVRLLENSAGHYTFISSVSVYGEIDRPGVDESHPVDRAETSADEEITPETYGPLKASCEDVVLAGFEERGLVIRPGLIVGPSDPTDRFTYWPRRVSSGGTVLAPGSPERQLQFIDARDLGEWNIRLAEQRVGGTFNATGPEPPLSFGAFLNECKAALDSDAQFEWMDDEGLLAAGAAPWQEIPLWLPAEASGMMAIDITRALSAGLEFRPVAETVIDTLEWDRTRPRDIEYQAGLAPDKEERILAARPAG